MYFIVTVFGFAEGMIAAGPADVTRIRDKRAVPHLQRPHNETEAARELPQLPAGAAVMAGVSGLLITGTGQIRECVPRDQSRARYSGQRFSV
jgi:hypothetical protein